MFHHFSLMEIIGAIMHGLGQRILDLAPFISPWPEPDSPPRWWYWWYWQWQWDAYRDSRGVPTSWLITLYLEGAWKTLGLWMEEVGSWARDQATGLVRSWTGYVLHGWANFSLWIENLAQKVGPRIIWWADNLYQAAAKIYNWLPPEIRDNLRSWANLFDYHLQRARDWVRNTYHELISLGTAAWSWVRDKGRVVREWWDVARGVLDEFRANPTGFILARLGTTWTRIVWFVSNALDFYVALWGQHARDLADFLGDPAGWIYTRLEALLERLW